MAKQPKHAAVRRPIRLASYGNSFAPAPRRPGVVKQLDRTASPSAEEPADDWQVDEFGEREAGGEAEDFAPQPELRRIRRNFPAAGESYDGGLSDGYVYRITFAAGRLDRTYELIRVFLEEHGYGQVPVPADTKELRAFRLPPNLRQQLSLFGEDGYVHNPIRILFPREGTRRGALQLELYNEAEPGHLLKFHGRSVG